MTRETLRGAAALVLLAVAAFLPSGHVLDWAAGRYHTVHDFREGYAAGFVLLRLALGTLGVTALAWPRLTKGMFRGTVPLSRQAPADLRAAALLSALAVAAALPRLGDSWSHDEWYSVRDYIRHGPAVFLTRAEPNNHPLYSLMAWASFKALGQSEVAMRLPAMAFGALSPALLFLVLRGRRIDRLPAAFAAAALALNPFHVSEMHQGRAYAPIVCLTLAMCLLEPRALALGERRAWWAFVALGTAAVWSYVLAAVVPAALLVGRLRTGWRRGLLALWCVGAASLLLDAFVLPPMSKIAFADEWPSAAQVLSDFAASWMPWWLSLPLAAAAAAGLRHKALATWLLAALAGLLGIFLLRQHYLYTRFFVPAFPFLLLAAGAGIARAPGRWRAAAGAIVLASLLPSLARYEREGRLDFRAAAKWLSAEVRPGEDLGMIFDCRTVLAYWTPPALRDYTKDQRPLATERPAWFVVQRAWRLRAGYFAFLPREYVLAKEFSSVEGVIEIWRLRPVEGGS